MVDQCTVQYSIVIVIVVIVVVVVVVANYVKYRRRATSAYK